MTALLALALLVQAPEAVATVRLSIEKMHCEDCRASLEANLRRLKDVKEVRIDGVEAVVTLPEGPRPRRADFVAAVPGDLRLRSIDLALRGTVSPGTKPGLFLSPRAGRGSITLVNLEEKPKPEDDRIAKLEKAMGGKSRFEVSGEWREEKGVEKLALKSFAATDWKD